MTSRAFTKIARAWYGAPLDAFRADSNDSIIGCLSAGSGLSQFAVDPSQLAAWATEVTILKRALAGQKGHIWLEFEIPRLGRRVDAVVVTQSIVFAIEFKVGEETYRRSAIEQTWDYALDLKNFHEGSHHATIVPILVATGAKEEQSAEPQRDADDVYRPLCVSPHGLGAAIRMAHQLSANANVDRDAWAAAPYRPTPTIIEAARSLYASHTVENITRREADATNLSVTASRIDQIIEYARQNNRKCICFVTGVPGAGKTLVGLDVATRRSDPKHPTHAVFLSGNGPLVAVLRSALIRDERSREGRKRTRSGTAVRAFIQNVHHFRDDCIKDARAPADRVVIFDEAQRAWNREKTCAFMKQKKGIHDFSASEPEFLISCMDRHPDWAMIICLVGGGQEIHTGEAGISEWVQAIADRFPNWQMFISDRLVDDEYQIPINVQAQSKAGNASMEPNLHLAVAMRSFRAEHVSSFVKAVLDGEVERAKATLESFKSRYPIVLTRNLGRAKEWIRSRARGSERYGLVASSKAQRLKPHSIDIRVEVNPVHYFLNGPEDVRSSYYLEDAATEFQVQGLELDWACVAWDGDFRRTSDGWSHHRFRGSRWERIQQPQAQEFQKNAYRVLLTRARQGMVIVVPKGDRLDATRSAAYYDSTYSYLADIGLNVI